MPYITSEYYINDYEGVPVNGDAFNRLAKRASEIIDKLTEYQIKMKGFDSFIDFDKSQIKKATAAQVEYLVSNGEHLAQGAGEFGQVRAGNFSYGSRQGDANESRTERMTSSAVIAHLTPTGLLYRGVSVNG